LPRGRELHRLVKIISGGQTGADRAAWDAAIEANVEYGGWVPRGRMAEDGPIDDRYRNLHEASIVDPDLRTEWNVRDSDATLILSHGPLEGGSESTRRLAAQYGRAWLWVDLGAVPLSDAVEQVRQWLDRHGGAILNVAGPRHSEDPRIYAATRSLLKALLLPSKRDERIE
jgi:putative molybdenum carrier protein